MKILSVFVFLSFFTGAQVPDSIRLLAPVEIVIPKSVTYVVYTPIQWLFRLNAKQIEELNVNDAGELVQRLPGVNMRSYGGLGGLKTYSYRGLTTQDNAIVVDGFEVTNTQSGITNLSQLESDNISMVERVEPHSSYTLLPVSALLKGNALNFVTFNATTSYDSIQIRANVKYGSFGHKDAFLAMKFNRGRRHLSVFGKYRHAHGAYPFSHLNGQTLYKGVRENNEFMDTYAGAFFTHQNPSGSALRLAYTYKIQDQQLPGAVILYNSTADETMRTGDHNVSADFTGRYGVDARYRIYGTANRNVLNYSDPNFLNNSGGLQSIYTNYSANAGIVGMMDIFSYRFRFVYGAETRYSHLQADGADVGIPQRLSSHGLLALDYSESRYKIGAKLGVGHYLDVNNEREERRMEVALQPSFQISTIEIGRYRIKQSLLYQRSFRMPTFNELYYNSIGNTSLNPERADQFSYTLSSNPLRKKVTMYMLASAFYNNVKDKIVAIPTKNMMVWSIQNIGQAQVYGGETSLKVYYTIKDHWTLELTSAYTHLRSIDITDPLSPTYGHQVAYTPVHTLNSDFVISHRLYGFRVISSFVSQRYSLNENISMNEVEGFHVLDASAWYRLLLRNEQTITIQLNVKNISNTSYAYIRSFAMPGRNYLITLRYALH